ncbi:MAG: N-acetylglucosamine-6-phosphate deacetylase [Arachnia sp.]
MESSQVSVGHAITGDGIVENAVITIEDGRILAVDAGPPVEGEFEGLWAVPGFVDTHSHGAVGVSYGDPDVAANQRAIDYHRAQGSTTIFASTVTEPIEKLERQLAVLRGLVEREELAGIHLEGPFLAEEKKGAHDAALLRDPHPDSVERLIAAGGPALKMITMAVEREHSEAAIRRFTQAGVKVAFGHSNADEAGTRESLGWGVCIATHLFSAMNPIHHRHPGPVPVLLSDDRCMVELICDGIHHAPVIARMSIDAAGIDRVAMVTDSMSATGQGDGRYILGELKVDVKDGTARLVTSDGTQGAIAGSTHTMAKAFKFLVQEVGCSLEEAAIMTSTTPAHWHGLNSVGVLETGRWADICLVDGEGTLHGVMRRGRTIV